MTFNYFNPSNLAFGSKLTTAFTQLNNLADSAEENLEQTFAQQEFFEMYDNKNYPCARPTQPYNPIRSTEFYDMLNDRSIIINKILFNKNTNLVECDVTLFDRNTNRITRGRGTTDLKEGYCWVKKAVSNVNPYRELTFTDEEVRDQGIGLFGFRVDSDNNLNITGDLSNMHLIPCDCTQYISLEHGDQLAGQNETYTSNDYQCVCVVGNINNIQVNLNDKTVQQGYGANNVRYCMLYLKPDDIVSGSYARIFKVVYKIGNPVPKEIVTYRYQPIAYGSESFTSRLRVEGIGMDYSSTRDWDNQSTIRYSSSNGLYFNRGQRIVQMTLTPQTGLGFYESDNIDTFLGSEFSLGTSDSVLLPWYGTAQIIGGSGAIETIDIPDGSSAASVKFTKQIPTNGHIEITMYAAGSNHYDPGHSFSFNIRSFDLKVIRVAE